MLSKNKDALNMIDRFLQAAAEEIEELCIEEMVQKFKPQEVHISK